MAEHCHARMLDRLDDAGGHLLLRLIEKRVDAGDDVVEAGESLVVEIERTVPEDVALRALEDAEALERFIERIDLLLLLPDALHRETVGDVQRLRMIRDAEVLVTQLPGGLRHLL